MGRGKAGLALAFALVAAGLLAVTGRAGAAAAGKVTIASSEARRYVPGEVVVRFRPNVDPLTRLDVLETQGAATLETMGLPGLRLVKVHGSVADAVAALRDNPAVAYAEPNYLYHADAVPNDPRYAQLYGLARIAAPAAWDITTGSAAVKVAVVDTGVAGDHLDLVGNVLPGHDFVQNDSDPRDFNGHGTHVAGTIGARGNNGRGVAGVDWQVGIVPVRVLNGSGSGTNAQITSGFQYACAQGASVVNASLGGTGYSSAMRDAIASCPNTLFVVAAGNDGVDDDSSPHYPCNYGGPPDNLANVICVAATDSNDRLASFSNYGAGSVDLAAPGVGIQSTWPAYDTLSSQGFEDPFAGWTTTGTFGRSGVHASGSYSMSDSPAGNYAEGESYAYDPTAAASFSGRVGCQAAYSLRMATELNHDYLGVMASDDGFANYYWTGWSGSSGGSFLPLTADFSVYDGRPSISVGVTMQADFDGTVGDGGYVDDLRLRCLRPNGEDYDTISGTSMATPHVTGVAALVKAAHPGYSAVQVKNAILNGVDHLGGLAGKVGSGGRLNACKALGGCGAVAFRPPCVVPNVVGKKLAAAGAAIRARHCRVGRVTYVKSTARKRGRVVGESPKAGRRLGSDAKVALTIGRGPRRS